MVKTHEKYISVSPESLIQINNAQNNSANNSIDWDELLLDNNGHTFKVSNDYNK